MNFLAGTASLGDLAIGIRGQESVIVAELKAGSEETYAWLIGEFHQPVYSLIYRIVSNPSDAADTTQEVFLKVFRGIKNFNGQSSLKTWIYRIALHEASNRRRWWFRHSARETSMEQSSSCEENFSHNLEVEEALIDHSDSPFESMAHEEIRARVEEELSHIPEPFRTTVVLRDIEEMSYEEVAEIMEVSLGTVKSRLTRGREALKQRLFNYVKDAGPQLGLELPVARKAGVKAQAKFSADGGVGVAS